MMSLKVNTRLIESFLIILPIFLKILSVSCQASVKNGDTGQHGPCPLGSSSFELIAEIRDLQWDAYITMEEKYSAEQSRGMVRQRVHYVNKVSNKSQPTNDLWGSLLAATETYWVDTKENISLVRNDRTNTCETLKPNSIMSALRVDFIEFDMADCEHLFGTARLLNYFSRIRPKLRADMSGAKYFSKNAPSIRYSKRFTSATGVKVDVGVHYSEISLEPSNREHALPVALHFEWPELDSKGLVIEFSPVKFTRGSNLANDLDGELRHDSLMIQPASGCSAAISKSYRAPWSETETARPTNRFSFRASVRTFSVRPIVFDDDDAFDVQVAYDAWLYKMRVEVRAPPSALVVNSVQIFDFVVDKMTHILPRLGQNQHSFVEDLIEPDKHLSGNRLKHGPLGGSGKLNAGASFRCANAEINSSTRSVIFTLDNLLLGTQGEFAYLGQARVRGIQARVFEAVGTQLPFWLDPQMFHWEQPKFSQSEATSSSSPWKQPIHHYVTLVYFSEPSAEPARLLLVEVYQMDRDLKLVLSKRVISVFDFGWDLQAIRTPVLIASGPLSTSGESLLGLFSLVDYCSEWASSSQTDIESHARFEMLLESAEPLAFSAGLWLRENSAELKQALLSAIQLHMHLTLGLIYDFDTRFVDQLEAPSCGNAKKLEKSATPTMLTVSFNIGRLPDKLTKMVYLGQGRRKASKSWFLRVFSRQECFMIAAHLEFEVEFAHDPKTRSCFIATTKERGSKRNDDSGAFTIDMSAEMSVFKTLKASEYHKVSREWWLSEPLRADYRKNGLRLSLSLQEKPIKMSIKRLKIKQHAAGLVDGQTESQPDVLPGFKLIPQDSANRMGTVAHHEFERTLFRPTGKSPSKKSSSIEFNEERMTLGRCQSLCFADFACKSFSYCVSGAKLDCVLSQVNLGRADLGAKIASMARANPREIRLELDDSDTITITRNPNCVIYIKKYLSYYAKDGRDSVTIARIESLTPAADIEECASACFGRMLSASQKRHEQVSRALLQLDGAEPISRDIGNLPRQDEYSNAAASDESSDCYSFWYLDAMDLTREDSVAMSRLSAALANNQSADTNSNGSNGKGKQQLGGFCALPRSKDSKMLTLKSGEHRIINADHYAIGMDRLYEEEYGSRMKPSPLSDKEELAFARIREFAPRSLDIESVDLVKQSLARGDNFQLMNFVSKERCAALCFTQSAGLWPRCSSFDIIHYSINNRDHTRCILNSLSRSQALNLKRLDLIDSSQALSLNEQRWHYELKEGFSSKHYNDWETTNLENLTYIYDDKIDFVPKNPFSLWATLLVALGIMLGALISTFAQARVRRDSTSSDTGLALN